VRRHASLRDRAAGWAAPVVIGLILVGAATAAGILARGSSPHVSTLRSTSPARLLLLEVRTDSRVQMVVVGSSGRSATAVTIPPTVLLTIPGQGDGSARDVGMLGGPMAATTISNLMGAWIPHYAATDPAHLAAVVDRAGGIQLFGKLTSGTDVVTAMMSSGPSQALTWREALTGLFRAGARWTPTDLVATDDGGAAARVLTEARGATVEGLPTSNVVPGFARPDYGEIATLVDQRFGLGNRPPVRAIVLNGTGRPGVGEQVAKALIPKGFRIVISENASTFHHRKTLIAASSDAQRPAAQRVRRLLGVGTVSVSAVPSGLADVTILVGADFSKG
jgi:LytR cell envelope-related transcriptional attenuator